MRAQTDLFGETAPRRSFEQDAYGFLLRYARRTKGRPFCAEDVTIAASEAGIASTDARHWGKVFQQVAKDGFIRRSDVLFRRAFGNGTLAPGWVAV